MEFRYWIEKSSLSIKKIYSHRKLTRKKKKDNKKDEIGKLHLKKYLGAQTTIILSDVCKLLNDIYRFSLVL